jgi:hypothetical protein
MAIDPTGVAGALAVGKATEMAKLKVKATMP